MNRQPFPGFIGPTYSSQLGFADGEVCQNLYPELIESGSGKGGAQLGLAPTPGLDLFSEPPLSPCRASFSLDGRCFYVIGFAFVEIFPDGTRTVHGVVEMDGNPATISSSGDAGGQLFITSGGFGYIFILATDSLSVAIPGLVADFGGYLDGYFLALDTDDSIFRISDFLDGTTWNALQFRERLAAPDKWVTMVVTSSNIFLMGSRTYEVWWNSGAFPFPFEPIPNILYQEGVLAPYSAKRVGDSVISVQQNENGRGQVMMAQQYEPLRISDHGVEFSIAGYDDPTDAIGMSYSKFGHTFYGVTFVDQDITWFWDMATKMWHNRGFWNNNGSAPARMEAWRPLFYANAFGKDLFGDRADGRIYSLSDTHFLDANGVAIRRIRRTPHLSVTNRLIQYKRFELDMQVGVGLLTGQGSDPKVMMRYSDNGGGTWSNELTCGIGERGKFGTRVYWDRLGQGRNRVFEVSISDPVPWRMTNAYLNTGLGMS